MNCSGTDPRTRHLARNFAAGVVRVLLVVMLAACSPQPAGTSTPLPLGQARQAALSRLDELIFVDDPTKLEERIEDATAAEEIANIVRLAEEADQERAGRFWSCAETLVDALPAQWGTQGVDDTGTTLNYYLLDLQPDGPATLTLTGGADLVGDPITPDAQTRWLTAATGNVTGWSSDLADVVQERRLPEGLRPVLSGTRVCQVPLALTLTGARGRVWPAVLQRGFRGELSLQLGGHPFEIYDDDQE